MKTLNGLYLLPGCGHTYGLCAINNSEVYDKLLNWFHYHRKDNIYFL